MKNIIIPLSIVAGLLAYFMFSKKTSAATSTSEAGKNLIKKFEGLNLSAYGDGVYYSIGYGHNAKNITAGQRITQTEADAFFNTDIAWVESVIRNNVKQPINQNQFDALASFVFNIGSGNFQKSDVLKNINTGNFTMAANSFDHFTKAGGIVSNTLVSRRNIEKTLFLA